MTNANRSKPKWRTVRKIGLGRRGRRGFASFRGSSVQFESHVELDLIKRVRRDPGVLTIVSQPCRIEWRDHLSIRRSYTPDFLIRLEAGTEWEREEYLCEVKTLRDASRDTDLISKLRQAVSWAQLQGTSFALVLDHDLRRQRHDPPGAMVWRGRRTQLTRTASGPRRQQSATTSQGKSADENNPWKVSEILRPPKMIFRPNNNEVFSNGFSESIIAADQAAMSDEWQCSDLEGEDSARSFLRRISLRTEAMIEGANSGMEMQRRK